MPTSPILIATALAAEQACNGDEHTTATAIKAHGVTQYAVDQAIEQKVLKVGKLVKGSGRGRRARSLTLTARGRKMAQKAQA